MVGKLDGAKHCQVCGNTKIAKFHSGSMDQGSSSGEHSTNYATTWALAHSKMYVLQKFYFVCDGRKSETVGLVISKGPDKYMWWMHFEDYLWVESNEFDVHTAVCIVLKNGTEWKK